MDDQLKFSSMRQREYFGSPQHVNALSFKTTAKPNLEFSVLPIN